MDGEGEGEGEYTGGEAEHLGEELTSITHQSLWT